MDGDGRGGSGTSSLKGCVCVVGVVVVGACCAAGGDSLPRWDGKISAELDILSEHVVCGYVCWGQGKPTAFCGDRSDDCRAGSHRGGFGLGPGGGQGAGEAYYATVERHGGYQMGFGNDTKSELKGKKLPTSAQNR